MRKRLGNLQQWLVITMLLGVFVSTSSLTQAQSAPDTTLSHVDEIHSDTELSSIRPLMLANATQESSTTERPIRVTYISPYITVFWAEVRRFMTEVASDLGIELSFIDAGSRFQALQAAEKLKEISPKPDYLVFQYQHGVSQQIFKVAHDRGIKTFVINTDIPDNEVKDVGLPREKMPLWIGQIYSDNADVGYKLADELINIARKRQPKERLSILALGGELYVPVGEKRNQGLVKRINEDPGVELKRAIYTRWLEENGYQSTYELLQMYPDVDIIWAASDLLARGSIGAMQKLGYAPGEDIIVGGIDWSLDGLEAIEQGRMSVSLGGHFMEGGWALIMINDYHRGVDFKQELGVKINLPMSPINMTEAQEFRKIFKDGNWKNIDFKRFSKYYNSTLEAYTFSLDGVFKAYNEYVSHSQSKKMVGQKP